MVKMKLSEVEKELTAEELKQLSTASKKENRYDEDSPEMTEDMLKEFKRLSTNEHNKTIVSIRVSPSTLKKAKAVGKGYTSFLSRLLDVAINDEEMVKKCI